MYIAGWCASIGPPDFLVRLTSGDMLILETKGQETEQDKMRRRYLDEWTEAVNAHDGLGKDEAKAAPVSCANQGWNKTKTGPTV
jgi:hypothetical protein